MSLDSTETLIDRAVNFDKEVARVAKKVKAKMSRRGSLGLPPLLEKRRLEHLIPDGAFRVQAAFERVLVYEIAPAEQASIESGAGLIIPGTAKDKLRDSSPRGIIISAGLAALDALNTNGIDLGHIVLFTHYVIGTTPVEYIDGKELKIKIMQAGDITGSEDTALALRSGQLKIVWNKEERCYVYRKTGKKGDPKLPIVPKYVLNSI